MSSVHTGITLLGLNPLNPGDSIGKTPWLLGKDVLLIMGIGLVLALGLFYWAARAVRRQRRHRRHHTVPGILHQKSEETSPDEAADRRQQHHRRRRRRRRRHPDHAARNPTLAETGGLPPARSMDSPPSA